MVLRYILFNILNLYRIEANLRRYQGYRRFSVLQWLLRFGPDAGLAIKVLRKVKIYGAQRIREMLRQFAADLNVHGKTVHITSFHQPGKSGSVVLYELRHALKGRRWPVKIVDVTDIPELPQDSVIVFVDDMIGTGTQATKHIRNKLMLVLQSSHKPILYTLFGTTEGISEVKNNSKFRVECGKILKRGEYFYYDDNCPVFSSEEKRTLKRLNQMLYGEDNYDLGLLIAFYFGVPNNSMPILWKDGHKYESRGRGKKWLALLPRDF